MHAPLDRGNRNSEKRRYSLERHLIEESQTHRERVIRGQAIERKSHFFVSFVSGFERMSEGLNLLDQELIHCDSPALSRALSLAKSHRAMPCDCSKPRGEFRRIFD